MTQEVEVSLRIPNMKVRPLDENGYPIDHSTVRFRKLISVPTIPKPGDPMPLTTASGTILSANVVRADWNEHTQRFVVSCQYSNRSISQDEYGALMNDREWQMTPLI